MNENRFHRMGEMFSGFSPFGFSTQQSKKDFPTEPTNQEPSFRKKLHQEKRVEIKMECENCGHSMSNHGTVGNTKGVCMVPICNCRGLK